VSQELQHYTGCYCKKREAVASSLLYFFIFSVSVCAIAASGVPGGTFVSMNRFSSLCG
jgi:hypothetical protein